MFLYISLLFWSGVYRSNISQKSVTSNKKSVELNAVDRSEKSDRKIRLAYKEFLPKTPNDKLPVILIHGSPGNAEVFDGLAKLIDNRKLIAVDLPGFGSSEQNIPDYSIYAHAKYLEELLGKLDIKKAHFVGFSLGGGVILNLEDLSPNRVESISFISSIGVQEYELFGDYHINHFIHASQLAFCWIVQELTPHFGIFDGVPMSYSRNFYDTDQRPLRAVLQNIDKPFQIIHGKNDPLVPIEAAREHKRIVPQSEYHELDDNHFFIFQKPEQINKLLNTFWKTVENKEAKTRSNADLNRITDANKPFEFEILKAKGATIFVLFLLLAIISFFNEDLAFLLAGVFIAQSRFDFTFAVVSCLAGIFISILFWLLFGRFRDKSLTPFNKYRTSNIYTNRNFGFRLSLYFALGKTNDGFWFYPFKLALSSIIWMILLIFASYLLVNSFVWLSIFNLQNTFGLILCLITIYLLLSLAIKRFIK